MALRVVWLTPLILSSCLVQYPPNARALDTAQVRAERCLLRAFADSGIPVTDTTDFTVTFLATPVFREWCGADGPTRWDQSGTEPRAYSCYYLDTDTIVIHAGALTDDCFWQYTTLQHEMAHQFSYDVYGTHDYDHTNRLIWDTVLPAAWADCAILCSGGS